jgi:hypothetical protein
MCGDDTRHRQLGQKEMQVGVAPAKPRSLRYGKRGSLAMAAPKIFACESLSRGKAFSVPRSADVEERNYRI